MKPPLKWNWLYEIFTSTLEIPKTNWHHFLMFTHSFNLNVSLAIFCSCGKCKFWLFMLTEWGRGKNSHFTLLKTVKELDNFSCCQVTAQWMILCFLSKQTKVNSDGGGYKKVLKKGMNSVVYTEFIFNGLNKKDIKWMTDALN